MHVCSTLWSGPLADDLEMDAATRAKHERRRAIHYKRVVDDGAIYSQPFSEGGRSRGRRRCVQGTEAKTGQGGLVAHWQEDFRFAFPAMPTITAYLCTEVAEGEKASRRNNALPGYTSQGRRRRSVVGDWDPLGMRGTVSRTLLFQGLHSCRRTRR